MKSHGLIRVGVASVLVAGLLVVSSSTAAAETELWETEETSARLGANLQMFSAYRDLRNLENLRDLGQLRAPGRQSGWDDFPSGAGLGGAVGRLEWSVELGDEATLDVHNRFLWESTSLDPAFDELVTQGLEVSAGDDRRLDTNVDLVDEEGLSLSHDIDRLVLGLYFELFDLYVGRQAIRWGKSEMFPVADRFAPLSPFELDTIQRRGIDAARLVTALSADWELDLVVADRGPDEPLSLGARAEYFGLDFDAYGAVGRFWERLSAMGGMTWLLEDWQLFGEAEMLWNLDDENFDRPRAAAGVRRMAVDWRLGLEYHYNGFGVAFGDDYVDGLAGSELERGESYFLGRHYAGLNGMYFVNPELGGGGGLMVNVVDPSVVVFPTIRYELAERFSVGAGAYVGIGEQPRVELEEIGGGDEFGGVSFPAEFGAVSDLYYVQMTAFF